MPEFPAPKIVAHPAKQRVSFRRAHGSSAQAWRPRKRRALAYAELETTSAYSFLEGASHPEELVERAAALGLSACAITDRGTLGGAVRAHVAGKALGFPVVIGVRLDLDAEGDGASEVVVANADALARAEVDAARTRGGDAGPVAPMAATVSAATGEVAAREALAHAGPRASRPRRRRGLVRPVPPRMPAAPPFPLSVLVYPTDRAAYGRLCRLLTTGKRRAGKGGCRLSMDDLLASSQGLLAVARAPTEPDARFVRALARMRAVFDDDRLSIGASCTGGPDDAARLRRLRALARETGVPLAATNDVHYHDAARRPLQDVLVGIRHGTTVAEAGFRLFANAERRVKGAEEMAALFREAPAALERSGEVARRAGAFSLDALRYEYPDETCPPGVSPAAHLRALVDAGALRRYPGGVPERVRAQVDHELAVVAELRYEPYFLTVHELVDFARRRGILCQGRGAAANSAVCYCLGITALDPARIDVLFERFVSKERGEPPDIDIDFEHERREEVIQHVYARWGRDRAALTAEVITYRGRSAVREVGKALGLSQDAVERLARAVDGWTGKVDGDDLLVEAGLDPREPAMRRFLALSREILGFPRHRSQHVGGFVITRGALCETVPIEDAAMEGRSVIEWDKDDIEALGILKVDVLGLGMLTCLRKAFAHVERTSAAAVGAALGAAEPAAPAPVARQDALPPQAPASPSSVGASAVGATLVVALRRPIAGVRTSQRAGTRPAPTRQGSPPRARPPVGATLEVAPPRPLDTVAPGDASYGSIGSLALHTIPMEDAAVYDMICKADTVGVFQIESRAQMSMLPRLAPRTLYDLAIEVAIVRPGPIQGDMVHPYLRRRRGEEPVTYPSPAVERVLGKTLGVPLFQEQAMALAIVAAGFTPGEADRLRRAMAAWKRKSHEIDALGKKLVEGMVERGYPREFADRCFRQIQGFSEYGFPESHAASFALIVYVSAWLKRHHPAEFAAALLDSQPMGFYAPAQLVRDAKEHGVRVRPVDVDASGWDCRVEAGALRLGMRLVRGLSQEHADAIACARSRGPPFSTVAELRRRSGVPVKALRALARADAMRSMGLSRRQAVWQTTAMREERLPLFESSQAAAASHARGDVAPPPLDGATARDGVALPAAPVPVEVVSDYATTGLSLRPHPMSFARPSLAARGVVPASLLADEARMPDGSRALVAGLVLVRQRPATAKGILFMTLEDETGIANLIVRPQVYDRFRLAARHAGVVLAGGTVEREGSVVHVLVRHLVALSSPFAVDQPSRDFR